MSVLIYIIIFTTLGSLLALIGGTVLLTRKKLSHNLLYIINIRNEKSNGKRLEFWPLTIL